MAPADEPGQLQHCPRCLYSLRGLPNEHRCPECGLQVDRTWRVFGGRLMAADRTRFFQANVIWVALLTPMLVIFCTIAVYRGIWFLPVFPLAILALLLAIFLRPPRRFIAVAKEGVLVYLGRDRWERLAWSRVRRAVHDVLRKRFVLELHDGKVAITTFSVFRAFLAEADACAREINRAKPADLPESEGGPALKSSTIREQSLGRVGDAAAE